VPVLRHRPQDQPRPLLRLHAVVAVIVVEVFGVDFIDVLHESAFLELVPKTLAMKNFA